MENKLKFWIITDAPPTLDGIELYLNKIAPLGLGYDINVIQHVKKHLQYEIVGEHLVSCENLSGEADIIIMDMSALTLSNTLDKSYNLLKHFLRKHDASIFHLVSYCYQYAKETIYEIKTYFKEEDIVVTAGHNGNEAIANYIATQVLKYYPYVEKK